MKPIRLLPYALGIAAGAAAIVSARARGSGVRAAPALPEPGDRRDWGLGARVGLLGAGYSSAVLSVAAGRLGRDPAVAWMELGTALLGGGIVRQVPRLPQHAAGVAVHQAAETLRAAAWFGALGPWTRRLGPAATAVAAIPWAAATAAVEYYLILPRVQPWLPMQVPFWSAAGVRLASASTYPLAPLLDPSADDRERAWALGWAGALGAAFLLLAAAALRARSGREPRPLLGRLEADGPDADFLRRLAAQNELGLRLAELGAARGRSLTVGRLAELLAADHRGRIDLLDRWWRGAVGGAVPLEAAGEPPHWPGYAGDEPVERLAATSKPGFDRTFLALMIRNHERSILTCRRLLAEGRSPRVRLLARSVLHARERQVRYMTALLARPYPAPPPRAIPRSG